VILACRSSEKTLPVVDEIKEATGNTNVEFIQLDLSSLESIRHFSEAFHAKDLPLHVLLNNAGVMFGPYSETTDGIEYQFGTNHVGHFYLTQLLFDVLERSQPSRIVCLTSAAHQMSYSEGIRFDKINDRESYSELRAYGQSKLADLLFSRELARRCEGKQIFVNGVHPGYVATDLQRNMDGWGSIFSFFGRVGQYLFALTPHQGALTQLYAAAHPDIESKRMVGRYFVPIAKDATSHSQGSDMQAAAKLWTLTEDLLKAKVQAYKPAI